jgi:hypothetical protein
MPAWTSRPCPQAPFRSRAGQVRSEAALQPLEPNDTRFHQQSLDLVEFASRPWREQAGASQQQTRPQRLLLAGSDWPPMRGRGLREVLARPASRVDTPDGIRLLTVNAGRVERARAVEAVAAIS